MRIWSLHPQYLDAKGLVTLWRETLLAKHVLEGKTKGYRNHPQLTRFKQSDNPLGRINQYLAAVYEEALARGYNFDREKINWDFEASSMPVTTGQIGYEVRHLLGKLEARDPDTFKRISRMNEWATHPVFHVVDGAVESWEIV